LVLQGKGRRWLARGGRDLWLGQDLWRGGKSNEQQK